MRTERETSRLGGSFQVTGRVVVTDPCYTLETVQLPCGFILEAVPGTWRARVEYASNRETHGWGERVAVLETWLENTSRSYLAWEKLPGRACVDSGQAGVFNHSSYPAGDSTGGFEVPGTFYHRVCAATLGHDPNDQGRPNTHAGLSAGVLPEGAVARSGYGDGSYPVLVQRAEAGGPVVAVKIVFLGDEADDLEDDDDEEVA